MLILVEVPEFQLNNVLTGSPTTWARSNTFRPSLRRTWARWPRSVLVCWSVSSSRHRGFRRHRDRATLQEPLVRDRRPRRVRARGQAADPGAHLRTRTSAEGKGTPERGRGETGARTADPRESPDKRPPARRLATRNLGIRLQASGVRLRASRVSVYAS